MVTGYTIDIDTGGTFTDGFVVLGERVERVKVPTTPHDLTVCFLDCIRAGAERFGVSMEDLLYGTEIIRFSNTIGTNTIIERNGSKVGLLVTAGRESLAPTRTEDATSPLVLPDMVLGLEEEISSTGDVVHAPDEHVALAVAQDLIDRGASCLVVALANSELNPQNERLVRRVIKREYPHDFLGSVPVFLASDISPRSGEVERINAAVINAYIHSKLVRLLYKAGEDLRRRLYRRSLFVVHSNGGVARVAKTRAINTYNSGPAAGLLGARLLSRLYGDDNLIAADMGGTSFDLSYVLNGQASLTLRPEVEGFSVNVPMLAVRTIGAGGGSIASVKDGELRVGPQSAGALPGPVCFDLGGTEPTVTDADLILGVLNPDYFLGGTMKLNHDKALAAVMKTIAEPLDISAEEAALAIKKKVDATMGLEIKKLKHEIWPSELVPSLVVYGGAGPAHCCDIARVAGITKIIMTPFSAVFSAFSSSNMDVGHVYYRRGALPLKERGDLTALAEAVDSMKKEAARDMRGEGFSSGEVVVSLELFIQPVDGGLEFKVPADPDFFKDSAKIKDVIRQAYEFLAETGQGSPGELTLTTVSLTAQASVPHYEITELPATTREVRDAKKGSRPVFLDGSKGLQEIPIYDRLRLENGHNVLGPAVIESEQTTVLVPEGWRLSVDRYNNGLLEEVS